MGDRISIQFRNGKQKSVVLGKAYEFISLREESYEVEV